MRRSLIAILAILTIGALSIAQPKASDGKNEILVVVNGAAITYQEVVGDLDIQAEINAARSVQGISPNVSDAEIEEQLVFQSLQMFILQKLLDDEADRIQLKITDAHMRAILNQQRRRIGLDEKDVRGWASYLKERYNLTPSEYREKMRGDIRRNEIMNYMAGLYGPLPPQFPLEIYFSLSVTPGEVRKEFDRDADRWRIARDIDYRMFKLMYPADTAHGDKRKLLTAVVEGENSVHERVLNNESLEKASEGLQILIDGLAVPGITLELSERQTAEDDRDLEPMAYQLVLSVPESGGVSDVSALRETSDDDQEMEGVMFIHVYSRVDGDRRDFESPKVQQAIRQRIENQRYAQNRVKVEQALIKRAAIVPERNFKR